ncbi:MAG: nuclear transport factor 2 family protein [Acidobacteria bacterium]|nr:nuclear transport factor 2 family protein [Acidobacteriota bacterium]
MGVVDSQVDAYNSRDPERFLACYSPDVNVVDGAGNPIFEGRQEMRPSYRRLFERSPELHCEVMARIRIGKYVIDEQLVTGFVAGDHPKALHAVLIYRLGGNGIEHVHLPDAEPGAG